MTIHPFPLRFGLYALQSPARLLLSRTLHGKLILMLFHSILRHHPLPHHPYPPRHLLRSQYHCHLHPLSHYYPILLPRPFPVLSLFLHLFPLALSVAICYRFLRIERPSFRAVGEEADKKPLTEQHDDCHRPSCHQSSGSSLLFSLFSSLFLVCLCFFASCRCCSSFSLFLLFTPLLSCLFLLIKRLVCLSHG